MRRNISKLYTSIKEIGGSLKFTLEDKRIKALIFIVTSDLKIELKSLEFVKKFELYCEDPFEIEEELGFGESIKEALTELDKYDDAIDYLYCLAEIHKRRLKYSKIMENQPFPTPIQVYPRGIIEYNLKTGSSSFLRNWLIWRKWIYDIDNRAAQETGYLFEPILAAAIGGIRYSAKTSPIKRADKPNQGRQVDCILLESDDRKYAYEFKMRITIAASGQGRFAEELSFASDVQSSGYIPVLIVLDSTDSSKLEEISSKFRAHGGLVYTGEDAWEHLEQRAGSNMSVFIEKYIHRPIAELESTELALPLPVYISSTREDLKISIDGYEKIHPRHSSEGFEIEIDDAEIVDEV